MNMKTNEVREVEWIRLENMSTPKWHAHFHSFLNFGSIWLMSWQLKVKGAGDSTLKPINQLTNSSVDTEVTGSTLTGICFHKSLLPEVRGLHIKQPNRLCKIILYIYCHYSKCCLLLTLYMQSNTCPTWKHLLEIIFRKPFSTVATVLWISPK